MSKKTDAIREIKDRFKEWTGNTMLAKTEDEMTEEIQRAYFSLMSEVEEQERIMTSLVNEAFGN